MAVCDVCGYEMQAGVSCSTEGLVVRGQVYEPIRWGKERRYPKSMTRRPPERRCGDCNTPPGGVHHHGCDVEECPACRWQYISCQCHDDITEIYAAPEVPGPKPAAGRWRPTRQQRLARCIRRW